MIGGPLLVTVLSAGGALVVLMAVTFALGVRLRRHSVFDVAWGTGIALVAVVAAVTSAGHGLTTRRVALLVTAVIWGLRLAVHISRRRGEDPRYRDLLARAPGNQNAYALRVVYLPQAVILWLACMPIQVGMYERAPGPAALIAGLALWVLGFGFEAVGDWQLARFKADPAQAGLIMDRGLWRYTRHPNYFGDACMWWGLFAIGGNLVTVFSPLLMTYILTRGSGQRLTDSRMASRPGYADYMARTSGFFPLPPRRSKG
jgi:steroid 5-alpha reductase family enzyme